MYHNTGCLYLCHYALGIYQLSHRITSHFYPSQHPGFYPYFYLSILFGSDRPHTVHPGRGYSSEESEKDTPSLKHTQFFKTFLGYS